LAFGPYFQVGAAKDKRTMPGFSFRDPPRGELVGIQVPFGLHLSGRLKNDHLKRIAAFGELTTVSLVGSVPTDSLVSDLHRFK
jgi:hypothetical protein